MEVERQKHMREIYTFGDPQPLIDPMADLVNLKKNSEEPEDKKNGGDAFFKPKQNSDAIETDSESPENTVRRPVTQSLIPKRARAIVGKTTAKPAPSSGYKQKQQDNVFSLEQECFETLQDSGQRSSKFQKKRENTHEVFLPEKDNSTEIQQAINRRGKRPPAEKASLGGTNVGDFRGYLPDNLVPEKTISENEIRFQKKRKNTGFRTETHEVCLPTKIQQAINKRVKRPSAKKAYSGGTKIAGFQSSLPDNEKEFPELVKTIPEKEIYRSPFKSKIFGDCDKSTSRNQFQDSENPSFKDAVNPEDNFLSPTFAIRRPVSSSSPSSIPKSDQTADCSNPAPMERRFVIGDIHRFRTPSTSKQDFSENAQTQSSDAAEEIRDSPLMKTTPGMEKNDAESGLSVSSSEERDLGTFEEGSPVIQGLKWIGEDKCMEEPSEPIEVDGLARADELFALGIAKLKTKMKTATRRKSFEILASVVAEVQLQLQIVESQIQTDMGKLTNLSKLKRKKLKTRFEGPKRHGTCIVVIVGRKYIGIAADGRAVIANPRSQRFGLIDTGVWNKLFRIGRYLIAVCSGDNRACRNLISRIRRSGHTGSIMEVTAFCNAILHGFELDFGDEWGTVMVFGYWSGFPRCYSTDSGECNRLRPGAILGMGGGFVHAAAHLRRRGFGRHTGREAGMGYLIESNAAASVREVTCGGYVTSVAIPNKRRIAEIRRDDHVLGIMAARFHRFRIQLSACVVVASYGLAYTRNNEDNLTGVMEDRFPTHQQLHVLAVLNKRRGQPTVILRLMQFHDAAARDQLQIEFGSVVYESNRVVIQLLEPTQQHFQRYAVDFTRRDF